MVPVTFEPITMEHPALERLIVEFRSIYSNGGALLGCFAAVGAQGPNWFLPPNFSDPMDAKDALDQFLTSPAVVSTLPELRTENLLEYRVQAPQFRDPQFKSIDAFSLDGCIASALMFGGAYERFRGTARDAKALAVSACDAMFDDRYYDVWVYGSAAPWAPWFKAVAWDNTWIVIDRVSHRIWLLCTTDTDL